MTIGTIAFLLGLYVMPLILLAWGHRIRRRSARLRRAFWGAISGHCVAALLTLVAGLFLPEAWSDASPVRGFFGLWTLLLLPVVGALLASVTLSSPSPVRTMAAGRGRATWPPR